MAAHRKAPSASLPDGPITARWRRSSSGPRTKHAKAAPFKRNDAMFEALPIGVVVCPGTGIQDNLADKAKKLGIPVFRLGGA